MTLGFLYIKIVYTYVYYNYIVYTYYILYYVDQRNLLEGFREIINMFRLSYFFLSLVMIAVLVTAQREWEWEQQYISLTFN